MIRRKGNKIFDANFKTDNHQVLEFTENNWTNRAKNNFIINHNFGEEFLNIYEKHRKSFHISNVMKMLEEMEEVWGKYSYEKFENTRKNDNNNL